MNAPADILVVGSVALDSVRTPYGQVEEADEKYAAALAKEGFVALAPNYLEIVKDKLWSPALDQQLRGTLSWLENRPEVANKKLGAVGFSLGAHAISLSALDARLKAVVVYYGAYDVRAAKRTNLAPNIKVPVDFAAEVKAPALLLHGADHALRIFSFTKRDQNLVKLHII